MLKKQDYEDIGMLLQITKSIKDIYDELILLEQSNKKDSLEYKECLDKLNMTLSLEKNIFDRLTDNEKKTEAIITFLNDNVFKNVTTILYDSFLNIDKDMVKYRLLNSLAFKLLDGEIVENQEIDDIMRTKIKTIQNIYTFIYTDILELILSINEQNLSKNMIKIKYDLIFLFKIIEERMLQNNFKVNNNPYLINNCVTSFNYLEANYLKRIKDSITARIILDQLDDLLNKKNDYFINPDNMSKAITKQIIVRATMVIASEDVRNDIIETFKDVMDDEDLSLYLCIKIIKDSLSCFKQDIKIPKFVYFKKM